MFASIIRRVTTLLNRRRCPECGHKVHETVCEICGYDIVERARSQDFHFPVP